MCRKYWFEGIFIWWWEAKIWMKVIWLTSCWLFRREKLVYCLLVNGIKPSSWSFFHWRSLYYTSYLLYRLSIVLFRLVYHIFTLRFVIQNITVVKMRSDKEFIYCKKTVLGWQNESLLINPFIFAVHFNLAQYEY